MKILIDNKDTYIREFVYVALPKYIYREVLSELESESITILNEQFGINTKEVIKFALQNLKVSEDSNSYIIEINKNLNWKDQNLSLLINLITYGNRSVKGYNIIYREFKYVNENIENLYKKWLEGVL